MHYWKYILFLIILPTLTEAQVFSSKARFSIDFDMGCNPMTVNITELDNFGDVTRQYYFFEGAGITNSKTFSYQDPGIYQIVQVVGVDGIDDKTDTLFVEVMTALKPQVIIQKCNGNEISITSEDTYYDSLRVFFTLNDSATLVNGETTTFSFSNSNIQVIELKGLFNNADDQCSSFFEEITPLQILEAPRIESASIKESCKDVFKLYLELDGIDTLINYRIFLNQGSQTLLFDGFLTEPSFVLANIPFDRNQYCINIEVFDSCNNTTSISTDFCASSNELSLSPFASLYASYTNTGIFINLDSVNSGKFNIYRKLESEEYEFRSEQKGSFTDKVGSLGRKYLYKIDYIDDCDELLFSAETHPPFVEADSDGTNRYIVTFLSPENSLADSPVNEYQAGNEFANTTGDISQTEFIVQLDAKDGSPRQFITATSTYANDIILKSNSVTVRHELIIYVPSAFTPNGDGLNDTLELFGLPTEIATTNIYTRWSKLVYTSSEPSPGWDGTINGSRAPEGTYLYEIVFETASGEKRTQKGTFALINK